MDRNVMNGEKTCNWGTLEQMMNKEQLMNEQQLENTKVRNAQRLNGRKFIELECESSFHGNVSIFELGKILINFPSRYIA